MSNMIPTVVFEDDELLVLSKPPGLIVNRADSVKASTVQDWVEQRYSHDQTWLAGVAEDVEFADRSGLGHRIDKDTSGVLVVGKTPAAMKALLTQFQEHTVKKTYQALAHGYLPARAGIVSAPIVRDADNRTRFTVDEVGRESKTIFHVAEEYKGVNFSKLWADWPEDSNTRPMFEKMLTHVYQGFSLVSLQPKSGRTHQIRVHLKFLGHPIVGDYRYNSPRKAAIDAKWVPRQFLHASQITLKHPRTAESMTFSAPLPDDLVKVLTYLEPR